MNKTTQTRKKAATRPKNGQTDLKTAAQTLGKQKIDRELIKRCLPYYFETYRNEKHNPTDLATRFRLGLLLENYIMHLENTYKPLPIGEFLSVFTAWTDCEPVAEIAARFGLSLQQLHTITAYCCNTLCRQSLEFANDMQLQPKAYAKTNSELLAELYEKLGIEPPKTAAARLPKVVRQGFTALGLEVPKIEFGRFSTLPTAHKSFIWLERCRKKLLFEPQNAEIKQLINTIKRCENDLLKKSWYSEKH